VDAALENPDTRVLIARVVSSPVVEATITQVVDDTAARLPRSPALWQLINEIAGSPAVTEAIAQQSAGFADQIADDVRDRSRSADARLEQAAWKLFRRRSRQDGGGGSPTTATAT